MMADAIQIPPDTRLTVELEAGAWNVVMDWLSNAPFKTAAPLIQAIGEQLRRGAEEASAKLEGAKPPLERINGAAVDARS